MRDGLTSAQVRWRCNPDDLGFESTSELTPTYDIHGQEDAVEAHHDGRNDAHAKQQVERGQDGLRIQEIRDNQEIAQKDQEHAVALRARLEQFQGQHDDQQRDARVTPEQRAIVEVDPH